MNVHIQTGLINNIIKVCDSIMHKIIRLLIVMLLTVLFGTSCRIEEKHEASDNIQFRETVFQGENYCVYEKGASSETENEFSEAMNNNPISNDMNHRLYEEDLSTNKSIQLFYEEYVKAWKDELYFSIKNLNLYLDEDEKALFETAQSDWEKSLTQNMNFDSTLITGNSDILQVLGHQYLSSVQVYLIEQYMERDFHIKYLTYLIENNMNSKIKAENKTWNIFITN